MLLTIDPLVRPSANISLVSVHDSVLRRPVFKWFANQRRFSKNDFSCGTLITVVCKALISDIASTYTSLA